MRILILGDVSRASSTEYVRRHLRPYMKENKVDFTIVNGENSAENNGISKNSAEMLFDAGADVITTGNHAFKQYDSKTLFEDNPLVLRPYNYPGNLPGDGAVTVDVKGLTVLCINLLGVVMMEPLDNPFYTMDKILKRYKGQYDIAVVDFHAEATSEKLALAHYVDGKVTVFYGTHTHVATADECITENGMAYITDVGMCGPDNSILGIKPECIIEKMTMNWPVRFLPSENKVTCHGILVDVDEKTKKATKIQRITF